MHLAGAAITAGVIMLGAWLPFLPGRYDVLAVPVSGIAQLIGTAGLLPVPFAALLVLAERSPRLARWRVSLMLVTIVAAGLVWALVAVFAVLQSGFVLGVLVLVAGVWAARSARRTLASLRGGMTVRPHGFPTYLAIVPLTCAVLQFALIDRAIESSRLRAMRNAAPLIAAIE